MLDPFRLPRRFQRNAMTHRSFTTRSGTLQIWAGILTKGDRRFAHHDVEQDAYCAMWLLRGESLYRDAVLGEKRCGPGSLVCRLPGRRHSTIPIPDSGLIEFFIHLDVAWYRTLVRMGAVPDQPVAQIGWDETLAARCLTLIERLPALPNEAWPVALAEAQGILAAFTIRSGRPPQADPAIEHACRILADDLAGKLSLAGVARHIGLGSENFRKRFVRVIGEIPGVWRIRRRIDAACAQLLANRNTLAEVARMLGYPDVPTFAKQFRRVTGIPPRTWRRGMVGDLGEAKQTISGVPG